MIREPIQHDRTAGETLDPPDMAQPIHHAVPHDGLAEWQLQRVREAIASTAAPWSIEAMAALTGLSPSCFCKRFRTTAGLPPHRWQMLQRVERAKQLLHASHLTLTDIAYACGYASSAHFSTSFGRATGTTPSEYRRLIAASAELPEAAPSKGPFLPR